MNLRDAGLTTCTHEFLNSPPKSFYVHGTSLQLFYMVLVLHEVGDEGCSGIGTRLLHHVILCNHLLLVASLVLSIIDFLSLKLGVADFV